MKNALIITVALAALISVSYWFVNTVRPRAYTGENLSFAVGSGHLMVSNPGDRSVAVEMRSAGRLPFHIRSADLDLQASSRPTESELGTYHLVAFELPPGQHTIYVTNGRAVWFISNTNSRLDARVTPLRTAELQLTIMAAGTVILVALYSISSALQHRWLEWLRDKNAEQVLPTAATTQDTLSISS